MSSTILGRGRRLYRRFMFSSMLGGGIAGGVWCLTYYRHQNGMVPSNTKYNSKNFAVSRNEMIQKLKKERFDVIIVGGGATGSGVALDCATRGLKSALLEYEDFGSGTSSRSTKLLHGGVRYLEDAFKSLDISQLSLVIEALEERSHAMNISPYMTNAIPLIMPLYKIWQIPYFWAGIKLYDILAKISCCGNSGVPNCYYLSKSNAMHTFPLLSPKNLKGALVYFDGQHNDSRMCLSLALTSSTPDYIENFQSTILANYTSVIDILKNQNGDVIGVRVSDRLNGEEFDVFGKVIINCTGPFVDTIRKMKDSNAEQLVTPSAGVHIVLPKTYSPPNCGMIIPETSDKRVLFLLPWENNVLAGTTDAKCDLTHRPSPSSQEIDFILQEAARVLQVDESSLRKDITASWSGLRPLAYHPPNGISSTSKISRSHTILVENGGIISVIGGKWTTYRRMAQEAVDKAIEVHSDKLNPRNSCITKNLKLIGCHDSTKNNGIEAILPHTGSLLVDLRRRYTPKLSSEQIAHLVKNYGFRSQDILQIVENSKTNEEREHLLNSMVVGQNPIFAEVIYSVRHEMAMTLVDVIARRTRVAFLDAEGSLKSLSEISILMEKELGWSKAETEKQIKEAKVFLKTMKSTEK